MAYSAKGEDPPQGIRAHSTRAISSSWAERANVPSELICGNQRELARAKNMKKNQDKGKKQDDGLSAAARKQRDAQIMQEKQKKAMEKKDEPK
ncbi:small EDRK-rich factor 2 isoform X2 [Dendrobates tinctorius]|uniref:small EDRK-rich factor 2 isoform X2 n=1 Tax=Dendrobates tinctorius TaxID=92724 RepID=UPI003CC99E34